MKNQKEELISVGTRLPLDLYEKFSDICKGDRRSLSAQLLMLVEDFIDEHTVPTTRRTRRTK